ncbi:hypothetical protein BDP27DRAFT_610553 [Rhodocollybia butyracea]|uniref:Uncharacterized protein n=1 Tax=Rhodocollybia butyracea TaxID=206335 RepID=A0A9P5Q9E8_9AGAR|nr:hypothetical protein BDP27DRAFT_610553 [Rhodocollybia butyracea]
MSLHSVPDISLVDLILHGLLDPIPESLALYRNAVMQANQMNPPADQADPEARAGVTLNGLMALGTLSGEESGEHGIPRAWIGGVADIDIEGAKPETLRISSDPVTDPASRDDLLPKTSGPAPISTTDHLILSMKLPGASISAVSLHSQTVARSPIARSPIASASPEAAEFTGIILRQISL